MTATVFSGLRPVLPGLFLALVTLLYGYGMGAMFGAKEGDLKASLRDSAAAVEQAVYKGDEAMRTRAVEKGWAYLRRAHIHACGLGGANIAVLLLLGFLGAKRWLSRVLGLALGLGGLGYSLSWAMAGWRAPVLGSGKAGKDAVEWLAMPSVALVVLGTLVVAGLVIMAMLKPAKDPSPDVAG